MSKGQWHKRNVQTNKSNQAKSDKPALPKSPAAIPPVASTASDPSAPALPRMAYSMAETAEILGCNYFTIHRLLKRGLLRSSSALRTKLIPAKEIERFLAATME